MLFIARNVLAVALMVFALHAASARGEPKLADVKKDMTAGEVRKLLGKPDRVARQILFRRHLEQWVYEQLNARIELDCFPGDEPRVVNVLTGGRP